MPSIPPGPLETTIRLLAFLFIVFLVGGVIGIVYQRLKKVLTRRLE